MNPSFNRRVLVIDDEEVIRDSIREILDPPRAVSTGLEAAAAALFDEEAPVDQRRNELMRFEVDVAVNGRQGYEMARSAAESGRPYALIFLDMRMPGWNGLETASRIRGIDEKVEIVVITAYSDHTIDEIRERAGAGVGYFCKPFEVDEVRQTAIKGVYDWNRLRDLERLIQTVSSLRIAPSDLDLLLQNVLAQLSGLIGAQAAVLVHNPAGELRPLFLHGIDSMENFLRLPGADVRSLLSSRVDDVIQEKNLVIIPLESYAVVAVTDITTHLLQSTVYLARLFVEHSCKAIENARLHRELSRREKLATVGQALSEVVHDLRTPMNVIGGALRLAEDFPEDATLRNEMHGLALGATETYQGLLEDLLSFVKGIRVEPSEIDGAELLDGLRRQFEILSRDRPVRLRTEIPPGLRLRADRRKLHRALSNLVSNAIEAMRAHAVAEPSVVIEVTSRDGTVTIRVRDNGPGVPAEVRDAIFEPFSSHGKVQGTGLGCAISREIARAHGGDIEIEPSTEGASFLLRIPDRV